MSNEFDDGVDLDADMGDVKGGEFVVQYGGPYLIECVELALTCKKEGDPDRPGDYYVKFEGKIHDTTEDDLLATVGLKHWENFSITKKALFGLKNLFDAMAKENDPNLPTVREMWEDRKKNRILGRYEGRYFQANFKKNVYNNNESARMQRLKDADDWDGLTFEMAPDGTLTELGGPVAPTLASGNSGDVGMDSTVEI
jgi:hypothetical protein